MALLSDSSFVLSDNILVLQIFPTLTVNLAAAFLLLVSHMDIFAMAVENDQYFLLCLKGNKPFILFLSTIGIALVLLTLFKRKERPCHAMP